IERARARGVEALYSKADRRPAGDHARYRVGVDHPYRSVASYWNNKTVMITGASSGIGKGLALQIAASGGRLGLVARREEVLQEIVDEIKAQNGTAMAISADVGDAAAVQLAADRIRSELGPIDIMIANAGIGVTDHAANLNPNKVG